MPERRELPQDDAERDRSNAARNQLMSEQHMQIILRFIGVNARTSWKDMVEAKLRKLEGLTAIASARVTLEMQHRVRPAFRVLTWLEVPGPDFHAEARDHTWQAALVKVVRDLERQMRSRRNRRADRWKTNPHLGPASARVYAALGAGRG